MTWFKYLSDDNDLNFPSTFKYIQPSLKRQLSLLAPKEYIHKNDWLFVDIGNNEINKIYDQSSVKQSQNHSYLVVYEYDNLDQSSLSSTPSPVKTKVVDSIVYFQAAQNHEQYVSMSGKYCIYYGQDYLKYINATPYVENNKTKYAYIAIPEASAIAYDNLQSSPKHFDATPTDINLYQTVITQKSKGHYTLAFLNDGVDWKESVSQKPTARAFASFSGPNLKIHAMTGPANGKIKIRIVSKQEKTTDIEKVAIDWTEIDCFSLKEQEAVIYNTTKLEYKDYNLEIEVLEDKNILSTGKSVQIIKISFLKNMYITLGEQQISETLVFTSLGGVR